MVPLEQWLTSYMSLFFRDDLLSWSRSTTLPTAVNVPEAVQANVSLLLSRVREVAGPALPGTARTQGDAVHALIRSAVKEENLSRMDASWHPWF